MVVKRHITQQRLLQIFATVKSVRLQNIRDAAIEAFDHAVGFGRPGPGQAMLYFQGLAQLVKLMVATGLPQKSGYTRAISPLSAS